MTCEYLKWDSEFFGFKIGKISEYTNIKNFQNTINSFRDEGYRLIYCFTHPENIEVNNLLSKYAQLVDEKITYYKIIEKLNYDVDKNIIPCSKISTELISLVLQSGEFSRFKIDPNFPEGSLERLYVKWIENTINKKFGDILYVHMVNKIIGFITLRTANGIGNIDLIAVANDFRGQSIGSKLLMCAYNYFVNKNITNIEVVTQKNNILACKFYEKNNFKIKNIVNIYHLWLK